VRLVVLGRLQNPRTHFFFSLLFLLHRRKQPYDDLWISQTFLSNGAHHPAPSQASHYYGSAAEPSSADGHHWPSTGGHNHNNHHDPYRYAPSAAARDNDPGVAPYRHQNRSRRPPVVPEEPTGRQRVPNHLDRVPSSYGYDAMKTASWAYGGDHGGGGGGAARAAMYPSVPDDRYDSFSPGTGADEGHFYPAAHDRHYPVKSMYDPEIPSLVGSDHSSFELASDDDEEHGWDRKIRPEEKMRIMNGYMSEDEEDGGYYSRPVKARNAPPPKSPPMDHNNNGYYPRAAAKPRMMAALPPHDDYNGYYSQRSLVQHQQSRVPPVVAVAAAAAPSTNTKQQIEVAPGEWLPLRGAVETWSAVQNDFYMPTECVCCRNTIFCIQDAAYVLCPKCKVVSPGFSEDSKGGVGLGFTMEELAKWQTDIERTHKEAAKHRM
jgi:hypothetical protein